MRNPNGYGSVIKLSGNRRKPYGARITLKFDNRGFPVYKFLSYHETAEEALMVLGEYNRNPYDINLAKITMKELYDKWLAKAEQQGRISKATASAMKSAMNHCSKLHSAPYKKIKAYQMQDAIDDCGFGYSTQGAIKTLWKNLDLYAMEMDIITKKNSDLIHAAAIPPTEKQPFTDNEIALLWKHAEEPWVDTILIFIYSGWRISELLNMKSEAVDIEQGTMKGGVKSKSGKGRIVPIHSKILPFIQKYYDQNNQFLITHKGNKVYNERYYRIWSEIMNRLNMKHTVHECRHTFRSLLDSAGANKKCIDMMMGHTSKEVGERVYTHKTFTELKNDIELIIQ